MPLTSRAAAAHEPTAPSVLVCEWRLGDDGAARSSLRLVERWRRLGAAAELFAVSVAAPLPAGLEPAYPAGRPARMRHAAAHLPRRLLALARAADVVVSGRELGWGLLAGWAAARAARRPFVVVIRSAPLEAIAAYVPRWQRPLNRRALRRADGALCISEGLAAAARSAGIPADRVHVVLNGIVVDRVLDAARREPEAPLPAGPGPLVVGVGRLESQKGFDVLIRAHARLVALGREHRLLILGDGRERAQLQRLAAALGVEGSVHLPGLRLDAPAVMARADLFCLPSRWEGFGQSLAEAMVLGVPSIAADCVSGPRELLGGGRRGDLVGVGDVEGLARAIGAHLEDPARLGAMAADAREWAKTALDVERTAREMLERIAAIAAARRGG